MHQTRRLATSLLCVAVWSGCCALRLSVAVAEDAPAEKRALAFDADVLPIFRAKCLRCHAGVEPKAGLNLSQPSTLLTGGDSGAAIRIAAAESSLLYEKIAVDAMPAEGPKLTPEEKSIIRAWINEGAQGVDRGASVDRSDEITGVELWSFKPPRRPDVPMVAAKHRVSNPIDAFILSRLESEQLALAPEAGRLTLLRRASFDLTGLPPEPDEVDQFLGDDRADAYERLIDRVLASPRYGERWARHWLDVAGYADSAGVLFEDRPLDQTWRYRDYVIRAFNDDKPYDRFLQEQIAGDELTGYWSAYENMDQLPDEVVEGIIATGFLRTAADASRPDFASIKNASALYYYPTLFDTLQIVCSSTMGMTVQCARCHSHKFDPIPQVDYYRMQAVFANSLRPDAWVPQMNRRLPIASKKQKEAADKQNSEIDQAVKGLNDRLAAIKSQFGDRLFGARLAEVPADIRHGVATAFATAAENRSADQKALVEKFRASLRPDDKELDAALRSTFADYAPQADELTGQVAAHERQRVRFDEVRALYDLPGSFATPVLLRGDPLTPGPIVEPGVISTLAAPEPFAWSQPAEGSPTSGRRLAFARWLTQPEHPLTARVLVNRVWMHHFGTGIVATPEDFGVSGAPPTHPELLDWLATEFVRSGWSIKHLQRLILTSSTWRQQSRVDGEQAELATRVDPENRLLWRQNMRRLEAEPLLDALHAASGSLSGAMYGLSQAVNRLETGEVVVSGEATAARRSVYVTILRLNPETLLEAFDQPEMSVNCTRRSTSTVSTQALTLLNSDPMVRAAHAFADRVLAERPADPTSYALSLAFSRPASDAERELLDRFVDEQTARRLAEHSDDKTLPQEAVAAARRESLADLCHMLLSANEFAYVD